MVESADRVRRVTPFVVVDRVCDDDSAIVLHSHGRGSIAEGTWEVTERFELASGDCVILPQLRHMAAA